MEKVTLIKTGSNLRMIWKQQLIEIITQKRRWESLQQKRIYSKSSRLMRCMDMHKATCKIV
jgi:hypothetical protein